MKIRKELIFKILKIAALAVGVLLTNCLVFGFTNFGHLDVAEYISSNISSCKKEERTDKTIFEMKPINTKEVFFKTNRQAVAILSNFQKDSMYLTWQTEEENFSSDYSSTLQTHIYGITSRGNAQTIPFGLKILEGNFKSDYFNSYDYTESDPINYVYISKSLCGVLFPTLSLKESIGKEISNDKLTKNLIVAGVCADETIFNCYHENDYYIIGNHLNFSFRFDCERLVMKLDDNFNTNYSIFKKLFYSESWIPPFSEKAYIKLVFVDNEWLENEAKIVFLNSFAVPSFLPIVFDFFYLPIGFVAFAFVFKKDKLNFIKSVPFVCTSLFIILLLFWLAEKIISRQIWFGIHLVGAPVYSLIYAFFGTMMLTAGFIVSYYFYKHKQSKSIVSGDNFFEIDI